ncbi:hypothetical protein CFK41_11640 [Brachybacterium ginsengisoli]|uniref:DUF3046 domain-containing protein n=1 Tax=Brachybacterium ginsengisoli TaxID=1331682 RepID=A0A291GZ29_9MICO|nr:DUF3046 domain-containing protein [Brachybacterium ginsengisoli]ATG55344.1 hypothetical protein CFK41_11640 [Brachybacterium ginsengisoli]
MRRSEFTELADHVFGPALARTYTSDLVLEEIGGISAEQALERGVAVRSVWNALCDAMDVPDSARWEIAAEQRRR